MNPFGSISTTCKVVAGECVRAWPRRNFAVALLCLHLLAIETDGKRLKRSSSSSSGQFTFEHGGYAPPAVASDTNSSTKIDGVSAWREIRCVRVTGSGFKQEEVRIGIDYADKSSLRVFGEIDATDGVRSYSQEYARAANEYTLVPDANGDFDAFLFIHQESDTSDGALPDVGIIGGSAPGAASSTVYNVQDANLMVVWQGSAKNTQVTPSFAAEIVDPASPSLEKLLA